LSLKYSFYSEDLEKTVKEQEIKLKDFKECENEYYLDNQEKQNCPTPRCIGSGNVKDKHRTNRT
jgi:hypothetical protein